MPGPDVVPPVTRTPIASAWGKSVSDDLTDLWNTKANQSDLTATNANLAALQTTVSNLGGVSANSNNAARLGTDNKVYVREVVVKSTAPTAADFGQASIPIGAVWIQS